MTLKLEVKGGGLPYQFACTTDHSDIQKENGENGHSLMARLSLVNSFSHLRTGRSRVRMTGTWKTDVAVRMHTFNLVGKSNNTASVLL